MYNIIPFETPDKLILTNPQDFHTHLRWHLSGQSDLANEILRQVTQYQFQFSRIMAMPNVMPNHIKNIEDVLHYRWLLSQAMPIDKNYTETIFTISLKPDTTVKTLKKLKWLIWAVKYYPGWVTTWSWDVSWDIDINNPQTYEVLKYMEDEWIPLSLHPETTHATDKYWHTTKWFVHTAEKEFNSIIKQIAITFPNLVIVAEHISTKALADLVGSRIYKNLYGTITPQHLLLTAHDKEGGPKLVTPLHCKPNLKSPKDLIAIQKLILSWCPNVFFWSDSAPHPIHDKESLHCSAWVFSSPISIQLITDWFFDPKTIAFAIDNWYVKENSYVKELTQKLQAFIWENWNQVYWKPKQNKIITLNREIFTIPYSYWENPKLSPMLAWKDLKYSIVSVLAEANKWLTELIR